MPPKAPPQPSKKRKDPPNSSHTNSTSKKQKTGHHHHHHPRQRQLNARHLSTQTTSQAFQNGSLDVSAFVAAREFEIRALEQGMQRSRKALNRRAFQQVPKELRRRTASHDVRRVPKRLRGRAGREMAEDNTPTVTSRRRKMAGHMRLRVETVKKLRAMGAKKKAAKEGEKVAVIDPAAKKEQSTAGATKVEDKPKTRIPKVRKKATLAQPPTPKAKFRKRQRNKSWLPTHLFHAKRAHITPPSAPLWRFAIPLTPTQKSYRPTHRAVHERGVVAWDTSYMSTISLEGQERSLDGMLKALGILAGKGAWWEKWRNGRRVLDTFVFERERPHGMIAPVTVIWCVLAPANEDEVGKRKRRLFLRVHPSAFHQLWEEVIRLSKVAKPGVTVEDLRFEIGSIEITGPGSTEALLGALWPVKDLQEQDVANSVAKTWSSLAGLTNASSLPSGALLGFDVQDPRLHHPPRTTALPKTQEEQTKLLELLADWPVDRARTAPSLFDRQARLQGSKLPSQKSVNRRKGLALPGAYPDALPSDPSIPILLHTSTTAKSHTQQTSYHLLAPWRTIPPIWYSIHYYPLSTGGQPRFGGLDEQRQLAFEAGRPWFPADFPGTRAGWEWEVGERRKRLESWERRPRGKRVVWGKVDLGGGGGGGERGERGEVGRGWCCDWESLVEGLKGGERDAGGGAEVVCGAKEPTIATSDGANPKDDSANHDAPSNELPPPSRPTDLEGGPKEPSTIARNGAKAKDSNPKNDAPSKELPPPPKPTGLTQLSSTQAVQYLHGTQVPGLEYKLITVRLHLITRGVPQTCARIYRLPSASANSELRKQWLALHPKNQPKKSERKNGLPKLPKDAPPHVVQRRLAQSLLEPPKAGEGEYPACPGEEDLVGFVTTGNFNLAEGMGTGIGNLLLGKVLEAAGADGNKGKLCIIRNAGNEVGRLAKWEIV